MVKKLKATKMPFNIGERTNCVHTYDGILFSYKKKQTIAKTGRKFKSLLFKDRSQAEQATYCMIPIRHSGKASITEDSNTTAVARDLERGR